MIDVNDNSTRHWFLWTNMRLGILFQVLRQIPLALPPINVRIREELVGRSAVIHELVQVRNIVRKIAEDGNYEIAPECENGQLS
jgi:hypothetical protein